MPLLMKSLVNNVEYGKGSASSIKTAKNEASLAAWNELKKKYPNANI
jgi:dsRNA-specific ribonuclease